jgi:2-desacetyl-2-hydroxyethyl bacteriochlorophyllide A dehydrogenase
MTVATAVYFTGDCRVILEEKPLPTPGPSQLLVQTLVSAISAGTEMLFYRGQVPAGLPVDETIPALAGDIHYPLKYGYAAVGRVVAAGSALERDGWAGRLVFAFNPHESHFLVEPADLFPLPAGIAPEDAVFMPNMETAVNLVMDGGPTIGEQVAVFGQGVVGLLTTALLARVPLAGLVALDGYALRRERALAMGAHDVFDSGAPDGVARARAALQAGRAYAGADLVYELSGNPAALDGALGLAGFNSRIVVGSWYGQKRAGLDLGGRFHRGRIRLISSQVSTIDPAWSGRWSKARRLEVAWRMIEAIRPAGLITHRFPVAQAAEAYRLVDQDPGTTLQVVLTY